MAANPRTIGMFMDISVIIDSINVFLLLIRLIHDTDCFHLFCCKGNKKTDTIEL